MAVVADELLLNVKANVTQAMAGLSAVESKGSNIGNAVKGGVRIAGRALATLGVAAAGVGAVIGGFAIKGGITRALDTEDAVTMMNRLGMSTEEIETAIGAVDSAFDGTVFANPDGFALFGRLQGLGEDLDDIPDHIALIADMAAAGNVPLDQMSSIVERVIANGKVSGEELNRLADANVPLTKLAEALGVNVSELREMVSEGELTSDQFLEAAGSMEVFEGAAKSAGDTTRGAWSNVLAQLKVLGEKLVGPMLGENGPMVGLFKALRQTLIDVRPIIEKAGQALGNWLVPKIEELTEWLQDGGVQQLIEDLGDKFNAMRDGARDLADFIQRVWDNLSEGQGILSIINPYVETAKELFGDLFEKFKTGEIPTQGFADAALILVGPMGLLARELLPVLAPLLAAMIPPLVELANDAAPALASILAILVEEVLPPLVGIIEWLTELFEAYPGLLQAIVVGFVAFKVISVVVGLFQAYRTALAGATIAQYALNLAMSLNPIGLVIAAIAALIAAGYLLVKNWDTVSEWLVGVWEWIKDTAATVWEAIVDFIMEPVDWIVEKWAEVKETFTDLFRGAANAVRGPFNTVLGIIESGINKVIGLVNSAIDKINILPGVNIGKIGKVSIPRLAGGGVITRGGAALINDSTGPEQVTLSKGALVRPASPGDTGGRGPLVHIENMNGNDPHQVASDIGWELTKRGAA